MNGMDLSDKFASIKLKTYGPPWTPTTKKSHSMGKGPRTQPSARAITQVRNCPSCRDTPVGFAKDHPLSSAFLTTSTGLKHKTAYLHPDRATGQGNSSTNKCSECLLCSELIIEWA